MRWDWRRVRQSSGTLSVLAATVFVVAIVVDVFVITAGHRFEIVQNQARVGAAQTVLVKAIPAGPGDLVIVYPQAHEHDSPYSRMELFFTEPGQAARYLAGETPQPVHYYRDDLVVGGTDPAIRLVRPAGADVLEVVWVLHRAQPGTPQSEETLRDEAYEATTFPVIMEDWAVTAHFASIAAVGLAGLVALGLAGVWAHRVWWDLDLPFAMTVEGLGRVRRRLWLFLPLFVVACWSFLGFFTGELWEFPGPHEGWSKTIEWPMMGAVLAGLGAWALLLVSTKRMLRPG